MTIGQRRTGFFPPGTLRAIVLGWLVIAAIVLLRDWQKIADLQLLDPDDALRLVQVRALLAGQSWFDLHQYRVDPPAGVLMHWSRLVDLPIAAMISALRPVLGVPGAERAAAALVPLLTLLCACLCIGRIAAIKIGREAAMMASLLVIVLLPTMMQFEPLRIDHHGWQIVAVLAALNGLLTDSPRRGGTLAGIALAAGMSISIELLPFTALFALVFGLRWLLNPTRKMWLVHYCDALAVGSFLFFITTNANMSVAYCDAITPAYLAGMAAVAVAVRVLALFPRLGGPALLAGLAICGVIGGAATLLIAPSCSTGPFSHLDPLVRKFWYQNVSEGLPVWRQEVAFCVQLLLPPLVGLVAAIRLARREGEFWRDYAVLLGGAIVIGIIVARFGGVAGAIAIVPLVWQLRTWAKEATAVRGIQGKVLRILAIGLVFLPGIAIESFQNAAASLSLSQKKHSPIAVADMASEACGIPKSLPALARMGPITVFAPLDVGPHILVGTNASVVATGHHRGSAVMRDVIATFLADPEQARATVVQHHASYVLACNDLTELWIYAQEAPNGLAARLLHKQLPSWLEPVPGFEQGQLRLYRVR